MLLRMQVSISSQFQYGQKMLTKNSLTTEFLQNIKRSTTTKEEITCRFGGTQGWENVTLSQKKSQNSSNWCLIKLGWLIKIISCNVFRLSQDITDGEPQSDFKKSKY